MCHTDSGTGICYRNQMRQNVRISSPHVEVENNLERIKNFFELRFIARGNFCKCATSLCKLKSTFSEFEDMFLLYVLTIYSVFLSNLKKPYFMKVSFYNVHAFSANINGYMNRSVLKIWSLRFKRDFIRFSAKFQVFRVIPLQSSNEQSKTKNSCREILNRCEHAVTQAFV